MSTHKPILKEVFEAKNVFSFEEKKPYELVSRSTRHSRNDFSIPNE